MQNCKICEKSFLPPKNVPRAKTCSLKCNRRNQENIRSKRREDNRITGEKICECCGKKYLANGKYSWHKRKYCSSKCAHLICSRNRDSKNRLNGNWIKVLERDKYKCQICDKQGEAFVNNPKERMIVHHIDGSGETESPNHEMNNLLTLCQKCHFDIHRIQYRIIDGEFYVFGKIFEQIKLKQVKVLNN